MRAAAPLLVLAALAVGCKKRPSYDRSTPEKALASFFKALDADRIPEDLPLLVILERADAASWKARCESQGCSGGDYRVVKAGPATEYEATLVVDYRITGKNDALVMRGHQSPVQFLREPDGWRISQFGKTTRHRSGPSAVPAGDAGPAATDGGAATADPP